MTANQFHHFPIGVQQIATAWEPVENDEMLHGRLDVCGYVQDIVDWLGTISKIGLIDDELGCMLGKMLLARFPPVIQAIALERDALQRCGEPSLQQIWREELLYHRTQVPIATGLAQTEAKGEMTCHSLALLKSAGCGGGQPCTRSGNSVAKGWLLPK